MARPHKLNRKYSDEEIERGLTQLALAAGNRELAHEQTKALGKPIPAETLRTWATKQHRDRYLKIREEQAPRIATRIANEAEDLAVDLAQAERATLKVYLEKVHELKPSEIAGALRNITTSKSLNIDRIASPLRGRPTQVVEHRDATELWTKLRQLLPQAFDSTAEEIVDAEVVEVGTSVTSVAG
jgi:hypothetical protein